MANNSPFSSLYRPSIFLSFCLLITIIPTTRSDELRYMASYCSPEANTFPPNNTYNSTLHTLLQYLSSNATSNPNGFYNTSVHDDTIDNTFNAYFLCRGDIDSRTCHTCVSAAVTNKSSCSSSVRESVFYDKCLIRYSNDTLNGVLALSPAYSGQSGDAPGNKDNWEVLLGNTFRDLVTQAANNRTGRKYASTSVQFNALTTLYALAQCKPDLSLFDCQSCLMTQISKLQIKDGETYLTPTCFIRYEVYPFFEGAVRADSSPPTSVNSTATGTKGKKKGSTTIVLVSIIVPLAVLGMLIIGICLFKKKRNSKKYLLQDVKNVLGDITTAESLMFELGALEAATNNFSDNQILGHGGFGRVYKGSLPTGQEIAVKRLSKISGQGVEEFKNEVVLIANLQHRNLVKLLGFCLAGEEKLLVYEFVPNKSLNNFLFDARKQGELKWSTRYDIIRGIARGLLYLHEDSRQRIVHRDLKSGNILLDENMNPKIADFGLARIFNVEQTLDATSKIAGTYGYMAPEYAMHGQFSVRSDVYSFGVLVLEIVSGKKIGARFHPTGAGDLLTYAWKSLSEEKPLEFMDATLNNSYSSVAVLRCIHLGLWCAQENTNERPTMSMVNHILNSDSNTNTMPIPQCPRSFYGSSSESSLVSRLSLHSTTSTSNTSDSKPIC